MGVMKQIDIEIKNSEALKMIFHELDEMKKVISVLETRIDLLERDNILKK